MKPRILHIAIFAAGCLLFAVGVGLTYIPGVGRAAVDTASRLHETLIIVSAVMTFFLGPTLMILGFLWWVVTLIRGRDNDTADQA
jgi:hypothetical protein